MRGGSNASTVRHKSREGLSNERGEPSALVKPSSLSPGRASRVKAATHLAPSAGSEILPCRRRLSSRLNVVTGLFLPPLPED